MKSFEELCIPHRQWLHTVALSRVYDHSLAQDLVQETMCKALGAWETFLAGSEPRAWLLRILLNTFASRYRKAQRHSRINTQYPIDLVDALHTEPQTHDGLSDELTEAMESLPPLYREVVELADIQGISYLYISQRLGIPIGTVMSRLARGRRQLERRLAVYAENEYGIRRRQDRIARVLAASRRQRVAT